MEDGPFSRKKLADVDEELGKYDVEILKFLCKEVLPKRELQTMNRAIEIFDALAQKGKIQREKADFLLQCLHHMQKYNLIRKLGYRDLDIGTHIEENKCWEVTPYRVLLLRVAEDLGKSEVETVKFSLQEEYGVPKNQMDRVKSGLGVMDLLEMDGHITPGDISAVENIVLQVLGRTDMKNMLDEYKGYYAPKPVVTQPPKSATRTGEMRHEILTSRTTQPPNENQEQLPNLPIRSGEAHIHPVDFESVPPNEDNESMVQGATAAVGHNPMIAQVQPSSLNIIEHYKMEARPKGICLIINNVYFENEQLNRIGSDKDAEKLTNTFIKRNFIVRQRNDLKSNELIVCVSELSQEDHSRHDALVVCILSHGSEGTVHGIDSRQVQIGDLTTFFKSTSCRSLEGKPKIFFIQACQGVERKTVPVSAELHRDCLDVDVRGLGENKPTKVAPLIPGEPDFLLGFASVPGFASFRRRSRGTVYVDKLTNALDLYADRLDLTSLLTVVNSEVSKEILECNQNTTEEGQQTDPQPIRYLQVAAPLNGLTKRLYL